MILFAVDLINISFTKMLKFTVRESFVSATPDYFNYIDLDMQTILNLFEIDIKINLRNFLIHFLLSLLHMFSKCLIPWI